MRCSNTDHCVGDCTDGEESLFQSGSKVFNLTFRLLFGIAIFLLKKPNCIKGNCCAVCPYFLRYAACLSVDGRSLLSAPPRRASAQDLEHDPEHRIHAR